MSNSKDQKLTPKAYLNTLAFIHGALLVGILLFTVYIYATSEGFSVGFPKDNNVFVYLVPTIAVLSYFISNYLFYKQLKEIAKLNSLKGKLILYLKACIVRFAFLEGAAIFSIIAYRLNNNIFYLVISLLLILYLFKLRPSKNQVISDLGLNLEDQQDFQKNNREIN
jgi:divalent metal cation (Fe/Co/Zn/Cd) transporter